MSVENRNFSTKGLPQHTGTNRQSVLKQNKRNTLLNSEHNHTFVLFRMVQKQGV
jgi:hypothetical protein